MKQAIVIFPGESKIVEDIRKKYSPNYEQVKTHIHLVYTFDGVNQEELVKHIEDSLRAVEKFEIELKGLMTSVKEYYLYLLADEGGDKLIDLHVKLNSGLLNEFRSKDMPEYIPHITLGFFDSNDELIKGVEEIDEMNLSVKQEIDSVYLITLDGDNLVSKREFKFGGGK